MGDRYTITADQKQLEERFGVEITDRYSPRYNAAPTQTLPVITQGSQGLSFFYWGQIPNWSRNKAISDKLIFAEAENIHLKASSMKSLQTARCLVPIDGFYGWRQVSKKGRIPHYIMFGDKQVRSFPAIWEEFEDDDGNIVHTFKILTTPSNDLLKDMADRMPVIFEKEQEKIWLSGIDNVEELTALLLPYASDKMGTHTISPKFIDIKYDDASLIDHFAAADQHGNYSLFD